MDSILSEYNRLDISAAKFYVTIKVLMVRNTPSKGEHDDRPETSHFLFKPRLLYTHSLNFTSFLIIFVIQ